MIHSTRRAAFAAVLLVTLAGCESSTASGNDLPDSIYSCETNTATLCATWHRTGNRYVADWAQGSHAEITVGEFDEDGVSFIRNDPSGTSVGMHAVYVGVPVAGHGVQQGTVTWTHNGTTFSGAWTATW